MLPLLRRSCAPLLVLLAGAVLALGCFHSVYAAQAPVTDPTAVSNFIAAAQFLPPPSVGSGVGDFPIYTNDSAQGFVNGNAGYAFTANVSALHKSDFGIATLFAQLYSNAKYNKTIAPTDWFTQYLYALENIGYSTGGFSFLSQGLTGDTFQVSQSILTVFATLLGDEYPAELELVSSLLDSLNTGSGGPITIFDRESTDSNAGSFQITTIGEDEGIMSAHFTAWHLTVHQMTANFLWFKFATSDSTLEYDTETLAQSDTVWNSIPQGRNQTIRQQLTQKVTGRSGDFIADSDF